MGRPQYVPKGVGTQAEPPGHSNIPHRGTHLPNRQHTCAHILHPQTGRYTQRNPKKYADRSSQPRARTHFQDNTNTNNPRKGPRARTSRPGHRPALSYDPPTADPVHTTSARRRDLVHGTRPLPTRFLWPGVAVAARTHQHPFRPRQEGRTD